MDIPSIPAAPWLAFTRFHADRMVSRERICSRRLACAPPCFPSDASGPSTRPSGVCVAGRGSGVDEHPTGSGLPALASAVLCPRLTPPSSTRRLPVAPPPVLRVPGLEVSPDKNANGNCTTSAFTPGPAPKASVCCATLPGPLALYAVSVRRLAVLLSGFLSTVGHPPVVAFGSYCSYPLSREYGGARTGDFHPISSRPCWAYTTHWSRRP